jgi:electron transport complex protein RnfC
MLLRRYGTFTGGIDLPDEKHATLDSPIRPCCRPERLLVPLAPCDGPPAEPTIQVGQVVTASQRIASSAGKEGVHVFAPLSGRVAAIGRAWVAGGQAFFASPAIELVELSEPQPLAAVEPTFDWESAGPGDLLERISAGGLTTHRRPSQALANWLQNVRRRSCSVLIANVMENQPYVTADHRLTAEHGREVVCGLAILARAAEIAEVIIAVDGRRTGDYRELVAPARTHGISRVALPHKYPTGADAILVKVLTRREVPPGGSTMDVGAAVIDAATCFATYRWVVCGAPATARVVTVSGERSGEPGNCWTPFGTPYQDLHVLNAQAPPQEHPLVCGGPMVGLPSPPGAVVSPGADAVLALDTPSLPSPGPCIRCGWCTDHCPARLNVAALNDAFELGLVEQAARAVAPACVECGVCSYVCPARLPLSQRVRHLKRTILELRRAMPLFAAR